ncbi:hypothetical protein ACF0H5_007115 [Mactra antiquata]
MEIILLLCVAILLRLILILYGEWQNNSMAVKFTDIDYFVFHDAASFVHEGQSPYQRATYRYTPLLAWMLQPNIWFTPLFGKLLFIFFDCGTGYIIYKIICTRRTVSKTVSLVCASVWLFNPLSMTVSSRGNAESIMTCLVLLCVQCLMYGRTVMTAVVFGLAIHFKIYPITYALPIYLLLWCRHGNKNNMKDDGGVIYRMLYPTVDRLCFVVTTAFIVISLTAVFYYMYGWEFLYHTYLYHVTRKDIRHNFSPYFYTLYLLSGHGSSPIVGLAAFIPQVVLLLVFSMKFYKEPNLVFFLHTFAFVTFNKVCTSQYFLWYLCLLPGLMPNLTRISLLKASILSGLWFGGQGFWLLPAYYLEFQSQNTFLYIWLGGLVFFIVNCYIMYEIIDNFTSIPTQVCVSEKFQNQVRTANTDQRMKSNTQSLTEESVRNRSTM